MELGTLDLWYALREWHVLVGGRIQKIYLKDSTHVIQIYSKRLYQFVFVPGAAFFSEAKMQFPTTPGGYTMFLRKRLTGGRIKSVELVGFDRVVKLTVETKEGMLAFIIELFDDVNSMVVKDGKIISAKYYREYADRVIRGGQPYLPPPSKPAPWDADLTVLLGKPAGKAIATDLGIGGRWSDEVVAQADLEKTKTLTHTDIEHLHALCVTLRDHPIDAQYSELLAYPFPFHTATNKRESSETFNGAIDAVLRAPLETTHLAQAETEHAQKLNKQQKIIAAQQAQLETLEKQASENQRAGEFVYEHYAELQDLLHAIKADWKVKTYKEIKERYADHPKIKAIHPDGTIDIDL